MKSITILFAILLSFGTQSQNWVPLDKGMENWATIYNILPDTINNLIYATGYFTEDGNNIPMRGIAKWDGIKWDSVGNANSFGGIKWGICKYRDTLYTSSLVYDVSQPNLIKLNGSIWDTLTNSLGLNIKCFTEKNGILYFGGGFYKCGNDSTHFIGKYDGATLSGLTPPYFNSYGDAIGCMTFFQDTLYVGGVLYLYPPAYTLPRIAGFAKWDGTNLLQVSPEFSTAGNCLETMVVYKNELYIGGDFYKSDGFTGNCIMKWDGHNFTEVGGGANQRVTSMKVYNNELYVGGWFTEVGAGIVSKNIAKWDGSQWTSLNTDDFDDFYCVRDICIYKDELYVAGYFRKIGNDSISSIAKYNHPLLSVNNISNNSPSISICPNPSSGQFTLSYGTLQPSICIYNSLGKMIYKKEKAMQGSEVVDLSTYSKGIYFIKVQNGEKSYSKKLIVQ